MGIFVSSSKYEKLEKESVALREKNKMLLNLINDLHKNTDLLVVRNKSLESELKTKSFEIADIKNKNKIEISKLKLELAKSEEVWYATQRAKLNAEIKQKTAEKISELTHEIVLLRKSCISGFQSLSSTELEEFLNDLIKEKKIEEMEAAEKKGLILSMINVFKNILLVSEKENCNILTLMEIILDKDCNIVNEIKKSIQQIKIKHIKYESHLHKYVSNNPVDYTYKKQHIYAGAADTYLIKTNGMITTNNFIPKQESKDIIEVADAEDRTMLLKKDGTVFTISKDKSKIINHMEWDNIVSISTKGKHLVGLKSDGTVVSSGIRRYGQCDVNDWHNIIAISAGLYHTVGLKVDGTVVAVGNNEHKQCDVYDWHNIIAISAGSYHTVGLKADGTVVAVGNNGYLQDDYGPCDVDGWIDIMEISAGFWNTVGLKTDGSIVTVGYNRSHRLRNWELFK